MESLHSIEKKSQSDAPQKEILFSLPFLDKEIYAIWTTEIDPQKSYEEEIAYNKNILRGWIITLMFTWKEMMSDNKLPIDMDMDTQTFLRGMMESYIKLKAWGIDVNEILNDYKHVRSDGTEVQLDDKEMEQIFRQLITRYLEIYNQKFSWKLDKEILVKYLAFLKAWTPKNPFTDKTSLLPRKEKKYRKEEFKFAHRAEADKKQKALQVSVVTDDLLNYYVFKNMADSDFTSILTPQDCTTKDYENMKMILDIYDATTINDTIRFLEEYLDYKKNPDAFLQAIGNDVDRKLKEKEMDLLDDDKKYFESLVIDLAKYYRFKCLYQTKSNETMTDPKNLEDNRKIEELLLQLAPYFPHRKAYQQRIDY